MFVFQATSILGCSAVPVWNIIPVGFVDCLPPSWRHEKGHEMFFWISSLCSLPHFVCKCALIAHDLCGKLEYIGWKRLEEGHFIYPITGKYSSLLILDLSGSVFWEMNSHTPVSIPLPMCYKESQQTHWFSRVNFGCILPSFVIRTLGEKDRFYLCLSQWRNFRITQFQCQEQKWNYLCQSF